MNNLLYPTVSENWVFKGTTNAPFLYDIWNTRKIISLTTSQYNLLKKCNGRLTIKNINDSYDSLSLPQILLYLSKLENLGVIEFHKEGHPPRHYPSLGDFPPLNSLHWEITKKCNSHCLHCYQQKYKVSDQPDLSKYDLFDVVDQLKDANILKLAISGGEPLLVDYLFELLEYIEKNNIYVSSILTNGLLIDDKVVQNALTLKSKPDFFISLDGADPVTAMTIRGFKEPQAKRVFNKLINNIKMCIDAGLDVTINTVIHKDNVHNLDRLYLLIKNLGVSTWRIALGKEVGECVNNLNRFKIDLPIVFKAYKKLIINHLNDRKRNKIDNDFVLQIEHFFRLDVFSRLSPSSTESSICDYEGKVSSCCLKPNGDVVPCALMTDFVFGNILKSSLIDIWISKKMRDFKEMKIKHVSACKGCDFLEICCAGCRANAAFIHDGDLLSKDDLSCASIAFFVNEIKPLLAEYNICLRF